MDSQVTFYPFLCMKQIIQRYANQNKKYGSAYWDHDNENDLENVHFLEEINLPPIGACLIENNILGPIFVVNSLESIKNDDKGNNKANSGWDNYWNQSFFVGIDKFSLCLHFIILLLAKKVMWILIKKIYWRYF